MQYNNYQLCNVNIYHHSCVYYYLHYKYHQDVPVMLIIIFVMIVIVFALRLTYSHRHGVILTEQVQNLLFRV